MKRAKSSCPKARALVFWIYACRHPTVWHRHSRGGNNDRLSNLWLKVISRAAVEGALFNDRGSNAANGHVTSVEGNEGRYERQQFELGDAIHVSGELRPQENGSLIALASR